MKKGFSYGFSAVRPVPSRLSPDYKFSFMATVKSFAFDAISYVSTPNTKQSVRGTLYLTFPVKQMTILRSTSMQTCKILTKRDIRKLAMLSNTLWNVHAIMLVLRIKIMLMQLKCCLRKYCLCKNICKKAIL